MKARSEANTESGRSTAQVAAWVPSAHTADDSNQFLQRNKRASNLFDLVPALIPSFAPHQTVWSSACLSCPRKPFIQKDPAHSAGWTDCMNGSNSDRQWNTIAQLDREPNTMCNRPSHQTGMMNQSQSKVQCRLSTC